MTHHSQQYDLSCEFIDKNGPINSLTHFFRTARHPISALLPVLNVSL